MLNLGRCLEHDALPPHTQEGKLNGEPVCAHRFYQSASRTLSWFIALMTQRGRICMDIFSRSDDRRISATHAKFLAVNFCFVGMSARCVLVESNLAHELLSETVYICGKQVNELKTASYSLTQAVYTCSFLCECVVLFFFFRQESE